MKHRILRIGIVVEYNPFHNGHIYQINEIKKRWPNSTIIVAMSGKYVQRGDFAIASFNDRKKIALKYGIDEVFEIPQDKVIQAAHIFAQAAIDILNKQKIDILVFGSETDNIDDFILVAQTIQNNEEIYYKKIRSEMKKGFSFPKASQIVLQELINKSFVFPNDILGLEYVKTIINNNYNIKPICIKRTVGFHSDEIIGNITSATNIRKMILENNNLYKQFTPMIFDKKPDCIENYYGEFQKIIKNTDNEELKKIPLVSEGIENLFKKNIDIPTYEEFVNKVNSKRYTSSRIKRIMLQILLNANKLN